MKNILFIFLLIPLISLGQNTYQIAILKYNGGGDWYANPSSLPNLLNFIKQNTSIKVNLDENKVKIGDDLFFKNHYFYFLIYIKVKF
mgnify:CR=1 FL=1